MGCRYSDRQSMDLTRGGPPSYCVGLPVLSLLETRKLEHPVTCSSHTAGACEENPGSSLAHTTHPKHASTRCGQGQGLPTPRASLRHRRGDLLSYSILTLPGGSVTSHRSEAQPHEAAPPPPFQKPTASSRAPGHPQLQTGGSHDLLSFGF